MAESLEDAFERERDADALAPRAMAVQSEIVEERVELAGPRHGEALIAPAALR